MNSGFCHLKQKIGLSTTKEIKHDIRREIIHEQEPIAQRSASGPGPT